jgi:hypothetical protein
VLRYFVAVLILRRVAKNQWGRASPPSSCLGARRSRTDDLRIMKNWGAQDQPRGTARICCGDLRTGGALGYGRLPVAPEVALICSADSRSGGKGAHAWTLRRLDERALGEVVGGAEYDGHEDATCYPIGLGLHECSEGAAQS